MTASTTHLVILPAYNVGPRLREVVAEVLRHWQPALVVDDGSTDGGGRLLDELAAAEPRLRVVHLPRNAGKGAAVLAGAQAALADGFTHGLVMDADGQHPAASIGEFMAASRGEPAAMILGQPVFPANMPAERRHGRKLSVGLVHFELFGHAVPDPLFGFRVYPLVPLVDVLGAHRGGRRYDFDTEAAVRLCWAGVPPRVRPAPVFYFSRAEGGVSHFHYVRDNLSLAWMHTRLITELLLVRWPALLRHRRGWRAAAGLALLLVVTAAGRGAAPDPLVNPAHRLPPAAPEWADLAGAIARQPDTLAEFSESRRFPFKKDPVELQGEVRVSTAHGLSLHYTAPEERVVILDERGVVLRSRTGDTTPPADARADGANDALRRILRFDLAALEKDFDLYGARDGAAWTLALVTRDPAQRKTIDRITVAGEGEAVRRIGLWRAARQVVEIRLAPPHPPAPFTAEELKRYFR